ncbi:MAG: glycoside hydrolase family 25 protein [Lachnospiraceae bacterium]|nr:glycoside hydrolase family 25 protein [Lachnospiraceae bacterium]
MRRDPDRDNRISPTLLAVMGGVFAFMLLILIIVAVTNRKERPSREALTGLAQAQSGQGAAGGSASGPVEAAPEGGEASSLHPGDLDFWELYPEQKEEEEQVQEPAPEPENAPEEPAELPPSEDGKHTRIINRKGEEEWVLISQHLPKNDYDYTNLVSQDEFMKYYKDSRLVSFVGIDVSKYNDYIDFVKVKRAGIDFVMIRAGVRGYGAGTVTMDEYFQENLKRATDAGLEIGVYFTSQAVTAEEVLEETTLILQEIADYEVRYPIAVEMGFVQNDTARIETLSRAEKTELTKLFLDTVSAAGYNAMIFADKEWLIKEIDLSKLTAYDVWLSQPQDLPDYPYQFTMWQYRTNGTVDGVSGIVNLDISFIDYTEK